MLHINSELDKDFYRRTRNQKRVQYNGVWLKKTWFSVLNVNKKRHINGFHRLYVWKYSLRLVEFNITTNFYSALLKTTHLKYRMWPLNRTVLLSSLRQKDEACPCSCVGSLSNPAPETGSEHACLWVRQLFTFPRFALWGCVCVRKSAELE